MIHSPSDFIKYLSFSVPGITRRTWGYISEENPHKIPFVTELALWQGETDEKCSDQYVAWCVRRGWVQGEGMRSRADEPVREGEEGREGESG